MTVLAFTITFHSPFRVGASYASDGVSAAIDRADPLPADHLKGVMRAAAAQLLSDYQHLAIAQVFGSPRTPSPWAWSHATPDQPWKFDRRHRVTIDEQTHSAKKDHLVLAEQAWAPTANFTITRITPVTSTSSPALTEADHTALLRCAAAAVHGLGGWRRRGLGWVGITPDAAPVTADDIAALQALTQFQPGKASR